MIGRRSIVGIAVLCALAISAFGAASASAADTAWVCLSGEGPGQNWEDEHCKVKAGNKKFHTTEYGLGVIFAIIFRNALTTGEGTNAASKFKVHGALSGVETEVECTEVNGTGSLTNAVSGVTGTGTLEFAGCSVSKPAGKGCVVTGGAVTSKTLKGTTVGQAANKLLITANSGTELATIPIEKCSVGALNNKFPLTGSVLIDADGATTRMTASATTAANTVKLGGNKAGLDGALTTTDANGFGVLTMTH
jgi:hypothetical protein